MRMSRLANTRFQTLHGLCVALEAERKDLLDPEIKDFAWKYNLDDQLLHRLIKTMKKRGKHKSQDCTARAVCAWPLSWQVAK